MKNIIKYVLGIILIISGLGYLSNGSFLGGLLTILVGTALLPPVSKKHKEKYPFWRKAILRRSVLIAVAFIGFIIAGVQMNKQEQSNEPEITSKTSASTPKDISPKIINLNKITFDANGNKIKIDSTTITYKVLEVLKHNKLDPKQSVTGEFEQLSLLVKVNNYKQENLKEISELIKKEYIQFAPNNYYLEMWDDKKAYQKSIERDKYLSTLSDKLMKEFQKTRVPIGNKLEILTKKWDKKNYSFIADHNIAVSSIDGGFIYYPIQDWYYKEIGGKNFKK